jgi:cell division protein FtsI (penicillin-binding protein 3)
MGRARVALTLLAGLAAAGLLAARLGQLQVTRSDHYRQLAERQQQRIVQLTPRRGGILDRQGRELAVSLDVPSVYADPSEIRDPRAVARRLSPLLERDERALERLLRKDRFFVWLKRKVSPETREAVESLGIRGVRFVTESRRAYPKRERAAHVLGYVGLDNDGLAGLEYRFDDLIAGEPGAMLTLRDARGGTFLPEGLRRREPTGGYGLQLTIDEVIQYITDRELRRAVQKHDALGAAAVVMDPRTGDLLSITSLPTFDPNYFTSFPPATWTNRALGFALEPGSCLKFVTAAAALEWETHEPTDRIDCGRGSIRVGKTLVKDHHPYDVLTFSEVIAHSSNVGAIRIGQSVGPRRLHTMLERFGFGVPTGVDLPGESAGLLRPPSQWSQLSVASISMGQEVAVTPVQMASALSAVANGGTLYRPRVVRAVLNRAGGVHEERPPGEMRQAVSPATAATLREMLRGVVESGTGKKAALESYSAAGKTGTAQKIGSSGTYEKGRYVSSFIGFAPVEDPRIVIVVMVDEPRRAGFYGGVVAAPVFRAIAEDVLRYLRVPPVRDGRPQVVPETGGPPGSLQARL